MQVEDKQLVKKSDLEALHLLIQSDSELIRFELKEDMLEIQLEMQSKITARIGAMLIANIVIIVILFKVFI